MHYCNMFNYTIIVIYILFSVYYLTVDKSMILVNEFVVALP